MLSGLVVAGALGAPATAASAARGCPRGTETAVVTAYADVFSRAAPLAVDQRAASLAGGSTPAVRDLLERWLASPVGASSTVTVGGIHCPTRDRAVVDGDLVLNGVVLAEVLPPGRAVRQGGTWKVATRTFCTRMVLEDPALADAGPCAR